MLLERIIMQKERSMRVLIVLALTLSLSFPGLAGAQDREFTSNFDRGRCSFATSGNNLYFPLWPGYALVLEGEEEDDEGELQDIAAVITVLPETVLVDGIMTRVVEERETEDGELAEISRNFMALCRETGDLWYFGEDVQDFDDGEVVGSEGEWRAGVDGATAGILMPGQPLLGARHFQEMAPGVAEDFGEVVSLSASLDLPAGNFDNLLKVDEGSALDPDELSVKWYAPGIGMVKDDELELVDIIPPACQPNATTLCLNDGRFKVEVEWVRANGEEGMGKALLPSGDSGEFWFFRSENTELLVKVIDACDSNFNSFWFFAAGLTNVEVELTVTDTQTGITREYENELGKDFAPILDTQAFATCQ